MSNVSQSSKKSTAIDRKLVKDLQTILKGQRGVDVIGHLASTALCCGNGTVALVKIDRGDPAPRIRKKAK